MTFLKSIILFITVFLCLSAPPAMAQQKGPANAPAKHDWVVDNAHILSAQTIGALTQQSIQHEKETTNQFVIVTVRSLDGWKVEDYARWIGNTWGIGQKGRDNGVLLLVATDDRRLRIEVGRGLENVLTDSIAQSIIDNEITPYFKQGQMADGVTHGANAIVKALKGSYTPVKPASSGNLFDGLLKIILLPFFLIGRLFGFGGKGSRGGGGFSGGGGSFGGGGASGSW